MKTTPLLQIAAISATSVLTSHASLTWTGAGNGVSLYAENNWLDDNGVVPPANSINGGSDVTAVTGGLIEINAGAGEPSNFSPGFQVGTGNSLTIGGGKTLASGSNAEVVGGGAGTTLTVNGGATLNVGNVSNFETITVNGAAIDLLNVSGATNVNLTGATGNVASMTIDTGTITFSNGNPTFTSLTLSNSSAIFTGSAGFTSSELFPSQISLTNGSSWLSQFVSNNTILFVDGSSSIELKGSGDPINSQTNQSSVNLASGAQLIFRNTNELDDQLNDSGTGDIWVNGVRVTALNKDTLLSTADNLTYTAIPEPSSTSLLGLAGLALILRRRK
ncbi:PEP-CTERM sorting domain-containing protein [Verrucomicrobiaceae bacterium N1E253]|uniref:PEP-CTERM sorting domain-containing protein n=1 Tax=Oceaniferula marina TaxID=2748318 RepID=A0A851GE31_9BACT|nr:PEP-CTERM sorting domain-containing protein [Oceaniferula marina]NWK55803.1 PEP-CTERM sorting domain-containing protein [Oceaniferula marina]